MQASSEIVTLRVTSNKPTQEGEGEEVETETERETETVEEIPEIENTGFDLYIKDNKSYLDIDYINAREWTPFFRGMIMMFDGKADIPEGWAICDGQTYTYKGVETITPNLVGRFIKAVTDVTQVGVVNQGHLTEDNDFTLTQEHLPQHSHPHKPHTHTISELVGTVEESGNLSSDLDSSNYAYDISEQVTDVVSSVSYSDPEMSTTTASVVSGVDSSTQGGTTTGSNHTHSLIITGGNISETQSVEDVETWENKTIKIEPNAYALIFIIKL
jgi:microcystin-dependent protein